MAHRVHFLRTPGASEFMRNGKQTVKLERGCAYVLASVKAGHADDQVGRGLAEVVLPQEPFVGLTWRGAAMMRAKCVRPRRDRWRPQAARLIEEWVAPSARPRTA